MALRAPPEEPPRRSRAPRRLAARLAALLGVRGDEQRLVGWMAALFAVTQAGQGLGANAADTLFFLRFGVEHLPVLILASGPVVMLATLGHMVGLARRGAAGWLPAMLWGLAGLLVLERVGVAAGVPGIYPVVWLGGQVAILVSFTVMWNAAAEVCTTRQAKRLFPLFASAGIGGGVVGNALTGPLALLLGTANLLLVQAALVAGAGLVMARAVRPFIVQRDAERPAAAARDGSVVADLRAGLDVTLRTPLLRLAAGVGIAFSLLFFLVVFPFAEAVTTTFDTEAQVAGYLGTFSAVATAATLLVSLFGANRLFARLGVVATLLIVPVVYTLGFGLWLVAFGLVTATLVRGAQWVAVNALGATAWSSLFNVLGDRRRGQVLAFMAAVPTQFGTVLAGALLIVGGGLDPRWQAAIGFAIAVLTVVLVMQMRRGYATALVHAVRQGLVDVFSVPTPGIQKPTLDADANAALERALADPQPSTRAVAASLLGRLEPFEAPGEHEAATPQSAVEGAPSALAGSPASSEGLAHASGGSLRAPAGVIRALGDEDARVRLAALDGVAAQPAVVPLAHAALGDAAPEVRRRAIAILADHAADLGPAAAAALTDADPTVRATAASLVEEDEGRLVLEGMLRAPEARSREAALRALDRRPRHVDPDPATFTADPDRRVRAAAARCLQGRPEHAHTLAALLDDASVLVRTAAAEALAAGPETISVLLDVLATGSVRACEAALRALSDAGMVLEGFDEWVAGEVERARYLRVHAAALDGETATPARDALASLLRSRQERLQRWALMALDAPAMRTALPVLRRGVRSAHAETRAQAVEALDAIADRSFARGLIALLEDEVASDRSDPRSTLRELAGDFDEWVRALALRCLAEELSADLQQLQHAAAADPSELVRAAVAKWEPTRMETTRTLDTVDRVVALQRVPMFSQIDVEDLERVAAVTSERRYEPEELVFRYDTAGDEMLVLIAGEVAVLRPSGERIRTLGPGEHVGELALLSGRVRAADVVAGPDGVHALVLGEHELETILEERPEVAKAMLGTLAERLATM